MAPGSGGARDGAGPTLERTAVAVTREELEPQLESEGMVILAASRAEAFELPDLKHGVLTSALLKAFTTDGADDDRNGRLSVDELRKFVPIEVASIAARAAMEQKPIEYVHGSIVNWDLAALCLPTDRYRSTLRTWEDKGWIKYATNLRCRDVLERSAQGGELPAPDLAILAQMRNAMDGVDMERTRARILDDFVTSLAP